MIRASVRPHAGSLAVRRCLQRRAPAPLPLLGPRRLTVHGLPFHPLDKCLRNLVPHDHDAQDAILPQERSGANSGGLYGGIRSPRCGKIGRGAAPHGRDESEHDVNGRASTVVPASGAGGPASGTPSTSRGGSDSGAS